jgi:hypothetical protein
MTSARSKLSDARPFSFALKFLDFASFLDSVRLLVNWLYVKSHLLARNKIICGLQKSSLLDLLLLFSMPVSFTVTVPGAID